MKINKASIFYTASILGLSSVGLQFIGFIYRIFLTDMAGTEALGVYKLTIQLYTVLLTVCTSGVCLVATNKSASFVNNPAKIKKIIYNCFIVFLSIFSLCVVIMVTFPDFIAENILGDIRTKDAIYIMLLCIFLTGIENIIKNSLIGIKKVKYTAFSEVFEQIIRVILVLGLIYKFGDDNYGKISFLIVLGMTLSEIFSVIFLGVCFEKIHKTDKKCDDKVLFDIAKVALPVSFAAVINNIISSASTVVLPQRLVKAGLTHSEALSELGKVSGIAMPILILPIAIIGAYTMVIMPNISQSLQKNNYNNITRKINKSFEATGIIGIPTTFFLVFISKPFGRIFFSVDFSYKYMTMIGISVVLLYYQIVSASILNGLGKEKKVVFHSVVGEIVQLIITIFLCSIPNLHIYGYIIGMIVSPLIASLLNMTYIFENVKFNFRKFIINPLFCGMVLYIVTQNSYNILLGIYGSQKNVSIITSIIAFLTYLLMLKVFKINYIGYFKKLNINSK